jgi:hypothetical protein
MADKVTYYSIIGVGRSTENPSGLARRTYKGAARMDESLRRDFTWGPTAAVTDWEYGNLPGELVEINSGEAEELIERFREKWI